MILFYVFMNVEINLKVDDAIWLDCTMIYETAIFPQDNVSFHILSDAG